MVKLPGNVLSVAIMVMVMMSPVLIAATSGGNIQFPSLFNADEYDVVIVLTSENWWSSATSQNLTPADEAALAAYQDTGGNVLDDLTPATDAYVIWNATSDTTTVAAAIAFEGTNTRAVFSTAELSAAANQTDFHDSITAILAFLDSSSPPPTTTPTPEEPTPTPEEPTPIPTMSPPDHIWVENCYGCMGDTIEVNVMMANDTTIVDDFTMTFKFDTSMLDYQGCVAGDLDPGWTMFDCDEATASTITVAGFTLPPNEIPVGSEGCLAVLTFTVTCGGCAEGDSSELNLHNLLYDIAEFGTTNGMFTFTCLVTPTPEPTATPTNTGVQTNTQIPTVTPTQLPPDYIMIGTYYGCTDDEIDVMVMMGNETTVVDAFTMNILYDTSMLDYQGGVAGDLDPGWTIFVCDEALAGNITAAGFVLPPNKIPAGSEGCLVVLTFTVTCAGCMEGDGSALEPTNFRDDIETFAAVEGWFIFNSEGSPTPVPTDTPVPTSTPTGGPTPTMPPPDQIWVENCYGCTGDMIEVNVMMANGTMIVDTFEMTLTFDTSMLDYQGCVAGDLNPGWTMFDCNEAVAGNITAAGFALRPAEIPAGSEGSLVVLTFTVTCPGCEEGDSSELIPHNLLYDIAEFSTTNGMFTFTFLVTPTPEPTATPTNTGVPTVTPTEPPFPTATPTDTPEPTVTPTMEGPTVTPTQLPPDAVWIGTDYYGCTGDTIEVNVMMANGTMIVDTFEMTLTFDTSMLDYQGCVAGDLNPGWTMFGCNEAVAGNITAAGFALPPNEIPAGSEGSLVILSFTVTCSTCMEGDSSELIPDNFRDDIVDFAAGTGLFTFICEGTPTPVPTDTPIPTDTPEPTVTPTSPPPTGTVGPTETPEPTMTPTSPPPTITPTPEPTVTPTMEGPTVTPTQLPPDAVWIGTDYYGCTDDQIDVMVMMVNETTVVDAFTMNILYDTTMLQYDACVAGDLDPGWTMFGCNEAVAGNITAAGFALPPNEIPAGSEGSLVILSFTVTCSTCMEGDSSELIPDNFRDDIVDFAAGTGLFTFICEGTPTPVPTNTPIPTDTPEPTVTPTSPPPTGTVGPTETPKPTMTPTSPPPTITPTPEPTVTPTPVEECDWLGTRLELSQDDLYRAGDTFWLQCHVCNNTDEAMMDVPTAVLLGVYGENWFWPSWDQMFDFEYRDYVIGLTTFYALKPFVWPTVGGHVTGLEFYSGLLTPEMDNLVGEFGYLTFGYTDQ